MNSINSIFKEISDNSCMHIYINWNSWITKGFNKNNNVFIYALHGNNLVIISSLGIPFLGQQQPIFGLKMLELQLWFEKRGEVIQNFGRLFPCWITAFIYTQYLCYKVSVSNGATTLATPIGSENQPLKFVWGHGLGNLSNGE